MHRFMIAVMMICLVTTGLSHASPEQPTTMDDSGLSHLPDVIRRDIESWRERLASASCLKVVCETDETWANLYELDERGQPKVIAHERYQIHSWMTPDLVWMVVFQYDDGVVDTSSPYYQLLWKKETGSVWERTWLPDEQIYHIRKYQCENPLGPGDSLMVSRGCIHSTVMRSWLAGGRDLSACRSIALMREPNIAIVPPDPSQRGVWLDVFEKSFLRDESEDENELYRRHDFMLLARNEQGEPEVREWRTIVLTDPTHGGKRPHEIRAVRRFSYSFYNAPPQELSDATRAFAQEIEDALTATESDSHPNDKSIHQGNLKQHEM
jgi:hypothetical protein